MNHLCIGCGLCATVCPHNQIIMEFSTAHGFYQPSCTLQKCDIKCGFCVHCCPFDPENPATTAISSKIFHHIEGIINDDLLGYYLNTYEGYSQIHRSTSSSGGLSTWLLETLLKNDEIDGAICVGPSPDSPTLYDFRICQSRDDIRNCTGSCYQPVELSGALNVLRSHPGRRYAIVALPCYAKGLRLAMQNHPEIRSQVRFILGLVCGQMKSRNFVDYLCMKYAGRKMPSKAFFRLKRPGKPASNYAYKFTWPDDFTILLGWAETVSRPWKERWFTIEACDYCDDVFAECADATFMDAWLPEYSSEPDGRNLVIIRNPVLLKMFNGGADIIHFNPIEAKKVIASQRGVIHQKRLLSTLQKTHCTRGIRLPNIRKNNNSYLFDSLEAWTKRRIRQITQACIEKPVAELDDQISRIKRPLQIFKRPLQIIKSVYERGMSFRNRSSQKGKY